MFADGGPTYWALIPAAGVGRRMTAARPKQFLTLGNKSILAHTVTVFLENPLIRGVVVVLGPDVDRDLLDLPNGAGRLFQVTGGAERVDSVRNGLAFLAERGQPDDWVLVHDAARPCLPAADLQCLLDTLADDPVGGLLAVPSTDTLKYSDGRGGVAETLNRERVWRALTPQMFRLGVLDTALTAAAARGWAPTDESSAVEAAALGTPRLIEGSPMNIKITRPEDLDTALMYLIKQKRLGE